MQKVKITISPKKSVEQVTNHYSWLVYDRTEDDNRHFFAIINIKSHNHNQIRQMVALWLKHDGITSQNDITLFQNKERPGIIQVCARADWKAALLYGMWMMWCSLHKKKKRTVHANY